VCGRAVLYVCVCVCVMSLLELLRWIVHVLCSYLLFQDSREMYFLFFIGVS